MKKLLLILLPILLLLSTPVLAADSYTFKTGITGALSPSLVPDGALIYNNGGTIGGSPLSTDGTNVTASGAFSATSGSQNPVAITPTYNQTSGTAANTDLLINRTETAVGSGAQLLIDAQVGGESKYSVNNTGDVQLSSNSTHGGYVTKVYSATSGTLTGATDTIELNIPAGWVIKACQLHVKTAVTNAGDNTWSAELNDGSQEEVISAFSAAAQNTNVNHLAHADAGYGGTLTDAETDILLTPQGADFTAGEIEATCIAFGFDAWDAE